MDLTFRLINFYQAEKLHEFTKLKRPNDNSTSALKVNFMGKERWMKLNSFLSFYSKDQVYILGYMNQRKPLGFSVLLKDFKVRRYPGSLKAKEYESLVDVEGKKILISMNEPLTYKGWTIYQSGFEENDKGEVISSIFAINKDPGRFIKYFGSLLIVCGIFSLFYIKKTRY